jgi:hypothetical protein
MRTVALRLAAAGILAAIFLIPLALDVMRGRADEGMPVELTIRSFLPWHISLPPSLLRTLGDLALLPLNYFFALGIFGIGALVFWRQNGFRHATEDARVLTLCALSGLLLGTFTRSAILYNDLGWRVMLLTQFACLLWTAAAISLAAERRGVPALQLFRWPVGIGVLALLGYLGNLYNLASIRAHPLLGPELALFDPMFDRPALDHQLRRAYSWANAQLPADAVVQHNPAIARHIYDFGLYGRNRVAVADADAVVYGAAKADVDARLAIIGSIFTALLDPDAVRTRATGESIDVFVVSDADPVWADRTSWVWTTKPIYADSRVRLLHVANIGQENNQ